MVDNIRVVVRLRPLNSRETALEHYGAFAVAQDSQTLLQCGSNGRPAANLPVYTFGNYSGRGSCWLTHKRKNNKTASTLPTARISTCLTTRPRRSSTRPWRVSTVKKRNPPALCNHCLQRHHLHLRPDLLWQDAHHVGLTNGPWHHPSGCARGVQLCPQCTL